MKTSKTKEQIIDDYETRAGLKVVSGIVLFAGIVSAAILADGASRLPSTVALGLGVALAGVLLFAGLRCPICDGVNTPERVEAGVFRVRTGFYRCGACDLSSRQVAEYVDLLKRGVEVDESVVARFNRRDL